MKKLPKDISRWTNRQMLDRVLDNVFNLRTIPVETIKEARDLAEIIKIRKEIDANDMPLFQGIKEEDL